MPGPERKIARAKGKKIQVEYDKLSDALKPYLLEAVQKTLPEKGQFDAAIVAQKGTIAKLKELNDKLIGEFSTSLEEAEKRLDVIEDFCREVAVKLGMTVLFKVKLIDDSSESPTQENP